MPLNYIERKKHETINYTTWLLRKYLPGFSIENRKPRYGASYHLAAMTTKSTQEPFLAEPLESSQEGYQYFKHLVEQGG